MNQLQPGQVILERFVLERSLDPDSASQLWLAQDKRLDAPMLLRIYVGDTLAESGVRDVVMRDARHHRKLHHPSLARIFDVHETDDMLVVAIAWTEGELLAQTIGRTGAMPYGDVVERARPLLETLLHVHEEGGVHGRVDLDHVLVGADGAWTLLPGDGTMRARSDVRELGRLMAAVLTGGSLPPDGRELNDMAERLHSGRTLPALLNQLVTDMQMPDAASRPAGLRDVRNRLDQIDEYLGRATVAAAGDAVDAAPPPEPESEPEPAPAPAPRPAPRVAPRVAPQPAETGSRFSTRTLMVTLLVPIVLVGGFMIMRPKGDDAATTPDPATEVVQMTDDAADSGATPVPDAGSGATPAGDTGDATSEAEQAAQLEADRTAADQALGRYLSARQGADEIGAAVWLGEPYEMAASVAAMADTAYLEKRFADAAQIYNDAATAFERVVAGKDAALAGLLVEGRDALEAGEGDRAEKAFESVLLIDPGNEFATIGLQRAKTADEVATLMASGRVHESEDRLALALLDYATAMELDPQSTEAHAAHDRVEAAIADAEFRAVMARGLDAYHRGDLDFARATLLEAQSLRPDSTEVAEALDMVKAGRVSEYVIRLRDEGRNHEAAEDWQKAWNVYRQVLAVDADLAFAQEGRERCESMIRLEKHAQHFLDNPDTLTARGTRDDAVALVEELAAIPGKGPRMQGLYSDLAERVRLANTAMRVVLRSDEKTSVDVYRVGRFGTFRSKELELMPGVYTVVGHRKGYKDVRLTLRLEPGERNATLEVICTEAI